MTKSIQADKNHTDRAHKKLGGSGAHRWVNCTGSIFYLDELIPEEASEAALQGTIAHELAETTLNYFLEYKLTGEGNAHDLKKYEQDHIEGAEFYREKIWKDLLDESITGKAYGLEEEFLIDSSLDMGGIVDFWAVYIDDSAKRVGVVADYKFGFTPVVAKNNAQLAFYAVALRKEMKKGGKDLDLVYGAIIQPRIPEPEETPPHKSRRFQKVKFTAKQLDNWEKKFYKAAEEIFIQKKARFKVGDWCKFCQAKPICKAYNKEITAKTSLKLLDPEEVTLPVPETMSQEALTKVVVHYDLLKDFIDSCYTHVLNKMKAGIKFNGLKLVEGKSRRKWKQDETQIVTALLKHKINPTEQSLKNITTIEKELSKTYDKETAKEILSKHTEKSVPSLSVVLESDPRPEAQSLLDKL